MSKEPATHHIEDILEAIRTLPSARVMQNAGDVGVEIENKPVDPDKFNRAYVTIDGHRYAISVFRPGGEGLGDKQPEEIAAQPINFTSDFRESNPKLHALYVGWARETIQATHKFCRELWDQSRWPASMIASATWMEMVSYIKTDAAWFEAAALEFMQPGGDIVMDDKIYVGESLRHLPPGEYTGIIQERDGKLYFELPEDVMVKGD